MPADLIVSTVVMMFAGAAVLAALALFARQSLLVAYIVLGGLLGPSGFALVNHPATIQQIGHIGIIFLLFLLGLNLHPQKLLHMLREATVVTLASSVAFMALGAGVGWLFGFSPEQSLVIGAAVMFSSTIIGLKLLPTIELHHQHVGEIIISILLLQDIVAIVILLLLEGMAQAGMGWSRVALLAVSVPGLAAFALLFERYVLIRVLRRFDTIQEFIFLAAIGWCLGLAQLGTLLGLSYEIGAFIAGVALAYNPISRFIAESLKPLRDFFLIMFFFSLGAGFALPMLPAVILPAGLLALVMLAVKPAVFRLLLTGSGETSHLSWEIGVRLGQISEFSLLIAVLAAQSGVVNERTSYTIQAATLITFIVSSYLIMLRYPTPIAVNDRLRKD
ncbi:MAG: cation:proton antiporter [Gammaproteobacteria bacterium]